MTRLRTTITTLGLIAALSLTSGCGGGSHRNVATLGNSGSSSNSNSSDAKQDFRDAMLDYAKCMRDHGVDMPDPTFADSGNGGMGVIMQGGAKPADPNDPKFKAAETACKPILDAAQKNAPRPSPEDEAKMRDQALKVAQCMRDKGFDVPDPTFNENGGMQIQAKGAGGTSSDSEQSGGPDPKFQEAAKECAAQNGQPMLGGPQTQSGAG
jgi:hypothetical protein